ncbi:MAG: penicillin-binding protein 2 [Rhodospirillales bacterium]
MYRDTHRQKLFSRRTAMLAGGKMLLLSALVGRMYYLQVVESKRYATLADENRINFRLLPPPRGRVVDRFGVPMAVNQQNYRVMLISERTKDQDLETMLAALAEIIPITDGGRRRILREIRRKRSFVPITLRENLNWRQIARIEVNIPDLPGVMIDVGQNRYYPHGEDAAHVLGYVAAVSEDEIGGDPLLETPGFRIGKSGIEKAYDMDLRGTGGSSQMEVNAFGRVVRELNRREGQPGVEVALTIDMELQKLASRRLSGQSAAAVIIDVHHGDVLAMASAPSFEPNVFNKGLSTEAWKKLSSNTKAPLINKTISGLFPPGSTFKMVVALAALEKGVITPESQFFCPGFLELGNAKFHCWKRDGHGTVALGKGIAQSCDVYFYEIIRRTGVDRVADMARRFGFGQILGLDLPGEGRGLVPTREWKLATTGLSWQQGETLLTGIGQGYLLATPLQMAVMTARLVNGGFAVTPYLARGVAASGEAPPRRPPRFASLRVVPKHLKVIRDAMSAVVNSPMGTAFGARIIERGYEMGGKTGTVQVRRISEQEREQGVRENKDLPWNERDHALFVGFCPVGAPRYAAAVVVEHGGSGAKVAAPIVRDILLAAQRRRAADPEAGQRVERAPSPTTPAGKRRTGNDAAARSG